LHSSEAKKVATALPIPLLEAVTRTVLPFNPKSILCLLSG
jgi:hypothetical protein